MQDDTPSMIVILGTGVLCGLIGFLFGAVGPNYKQGQIDAIRGKIYYKLVEQEDGETHWERSSDD